MSRKPNERPLAIDVDEKILAQFKVSMKITALDLFGYRE